MSPPVPDVPTPSSPEDRIAPEDRVGLGGFFQGTVERPIALMVILISLIVLGAIAYRRLPVQLLPDGWTEPSLHVWIPNRGSSAKENEERIARPIEEQLRTMTGITRVWSQSSENSVEMNISFDNSLDMDLAKAEVRDRMERARPQFPETVTEVGMWSEDSDALPITFFGILLRGEPEERDFLMEKVVTPRLEAVDGVGNVQVWGVLEDSVRILLDEDKVAAAQLDIGRVIRRLSSDNFALPMGQIDDGGTELLLRSDMRFRSVEEIADFPIGDGMRLRDVGRVAKVKTVGNSLSRIDGAYAYYGMATKDSTSNVVEVSHALQATIEDLKEDPELRGRIDFLLFFLQGELIESALSQLQQTALWGGALAVIVLLVFLKRIRLTLCVALSIPVSALMALAWEYFTGGSFNLLTMTGITLGIGMLVDNAVVVVENIARLRAGGMGAHESAVRGARQIALAVTLATLTTVVVFLPLIFMTSHPIARLVFAGIGIPLSVSLMASLVVAVVFLPVIAARILGPRPAPVAAAAGLLAGIGGLPARLLGLLVAGLRWLGHGLLRAVHLAERFVLVTLCTRLGPLPSLRWALAAVVLALTALRVRAILPTADVGAPLEKFGAFALGGEKLRQVLVTNLGLCALGAVCLLAFALPPWHRRTRRHPARPERLVPASRSVIEMIVDLNHELVSWTLRHRLLATFFSFAAFLSVLVPASQLELAPFGEESSEDSIDFRVYFDTDFDLEEIEDQIVPYENFLEGRREKYDIEHISVRFDTQGARFSLYFEDRMPLAEHDRMEKELQADLPRFPGHRLRFYDENASRKTTNDVVGFRLVGPESDELDRLGAAAASILETVPGLAEISTPLESSPEEIEVVIDRDKAAGLGVDTQAVEQTISYVLRGFPLPRYQEKGREIPFLIEYDEAEVAGMPTLRDLNVFSEGTMVPLATFADLAFTKGSRGIFRMNGEVSFTIEARVQDPLQVVPITDRAYLALGQLEMPRGYYFDRGDSARTRQVEEFSEFRNAFVLSIVLVFLVMGILFESVALPFSVLVTIPFAACGAMWTLFLTGRPMDFMGWIGLIILAGVVVNNGIVLIDRIHGLRDGRPRSEAVVLGCGQRVRPVLMTALTTVCGLLPMMLSRPPQGGVDYRALATIVGGGLVFSTFFTLWVVPLAYTLIDDLRTVLAVRFRFWIGFPARAAARVRARRHPEPA